MKKTVVILLTLAMALALSSCKKESPPANPVESIPHDNVIDTASYVLPENVEAWVVDGSVDSSRIVINVVNTSKNEITLSTEFRVEKIEGDYWVNIPYRTEIDWDTKLYTLEPNSAKKMTVGFNLAYGELEPGIYRIVKQLFVHDDKTTYFMACEFKVE